MTLRTTTLIAGAVVLLSSAVAAFAQITSMEGTVKGRDGAPLSGAVIRIERTDFRARHQTKTARNGHFFYAGLPLGAYNVTCVVDGNDVDGVTGIHTQLGDPVQVNFDLRASAKKKEQPSQPPSGLGSTYVSSQNSADRLRLQADRSFSLQEKGNTFTGTYAIKGTTLTLHIVELQKDVDIAIEGNRLIVGGDEVWIQPATPREDAASAIHEAPLLSPSRPGASPSQPIPSATTRTSLDTLSEAVARGEEVALKVKYNTAVDYPYVYLADGLVTVSKTSVSFRPTFGVQGFAVLPEKILDVTNQPQKASWVLGRTAMTGVPALHLKVAIKDKKGAKDNKKDFYFVNPGAATVGQGPGGTGLSIECNECDDSIDVLYALLQRVREFHFQTPQEGAPSALVGRYVRRGKSSDYLELASDGTFHLLQGGKHYEGNYRIQADTIALEARTIRANLNRLVGSTIVEADGTVWEKIR